MPSSTRDCLAIDTMESPRPCKRMRMSATVTPPTTIHDPEGTSILDKATNILSVQATALSNITRLYQTDPSARDGLLSAVECIVKSQKAGGKVIVCGVGKSGLVGAKTVATLKSFGVGASFMHAAEAAHGDLGDIREVRLTANTLLEWSRVPTDMTCAERCHPLHILQRQDA